MSHHFTSARMVVFKIEKNYKCQQWCGKMDTVGGTIGIATLGNNTDISEKKKTN